MQKIQYIGNGVTKSFAWTGGSYNLHVFLEDIETSEYTLSGDSLTFNTAPASGEVITFMTYREIGNLPSFREEGIGVPSLDMNNKDIVDMLEGLGEKLNRTPTVPLSEQDDGSGFFTAFNEAKQDVEYVKDAKVQVEANVDSGLRSIVAEKNQSLVEMQVKVDASEAAADRAETAAAEAESYRIYPDIEEKDSQSKNYIKNKEGHFPETAINLLTENISAYRYGNHKGFYWQPNNSYATIERGYPFANEGGSLEILPAGMYAGKEYATQRFTSLVSQRTAVRSCGVVGNVEVWSDWEALEIDSALSTTSINPVQNKVVTNALNTKATTNYVNGTFANKGLGNLNADGQAKFNAKQDTLVSGTNIKTLNNQSLLGSGNIATWNPNTASAEDKATVNSWAERRMVESYSNGANWYKIFEEKQANGGVKYWCEQSGEYSVKGLITINLNKSFNNTNYLVLLRDSTDDDKASVNSTLEKTSGKNLSFFKVRSVANYSSRYGVSSWFACGYCDL